MQVAKAELAATRASVDRAGANIAKAEATAVQARLTFARIEKLQQSKAVSQDELDTATERRDVADAELRRAQLAKVELERQVAKGEESLRYYEERFADTKLLSPL